MRLVTINSKCLKSYTIDPEMLQKSDRPCALIVQLRYRGHRYDFAVPLRSNIAPSAPKNQYFSLPPRKATKSNHHHGVHYIKMFPIKRAFALRFRTDGNMYASLIKGILDANEKQIIKECQQYLTNYENGIHPNFSTDIDLLLKTIGL